MNCIYSQTIKSIQLRPAHNPKLFSPIVRLGEVLELSFDDLDADNKEYMYKVEHMTHDWKPSNLSSNQYIDGFDQNEIINFTNSFNTLQPYTHYSIKIPNANTIITKSGNYLISILDENYEVVFTRRCIFYEDISIVGVAVYRSRNTLQSNSEQTVQFSVNHPGLVINNPNQEVKAVLIQNNNWQTSINNIQPIFIKPQQLIYNHTQKTNFLGNNEFLNFDTKYARNTSLNIAKVERDDLYNSYLFTDESRANRPYTYNPDINGQFIINTLDAQDPITEADYTKVHFSLFLEEPINNKEIYVYGAFNGFKLEEENKMTYNKTNNIYETSIILKQGFYNYSYAVVNKNTINLNTIDGSFFETENEYTAIIYYRPFGGFYDRVIGIGNGFFNQNR
ncbi:type IX secretion system plug protein domain-containing protein [Tenacibaculum sp. 190524A02b]|uniref:type IX secretion system plug protein n=1 Tax=Tenacibaculum vairaonense TaxID=3137860 RepID=UPI0032B2AC1F